MSRRPNLRLGLDRDVYQIVLKLEEEGEDENGRKPRLTVGSVYDSIKRSNSSLARQKKRPLEDSIERVLAVRKEQSRADEEDDSDDLLESQEKERERAAKAERDSSLLNRQIAKSWGFANEKPAASSSTPTPVATPATTPGAPPPSEMFAAGAVGAGTPIVTSGGAPASGTDRQPNGEPRPKKRKGALKEVDRSPPTKVSILDIAGVDDTLEKLLHEVWFPLCAGEACEKMGYRYDNGVLLHGPSGCGKTTLAHAIAGSVGAAFIPVSAPSVIGGTSGESEKNIRDVFDEAIRLAPCLVFFDEIDSIAGKRESANKGMESRVVAEIMNGMDRIKQNTPLGKNVVVLAATNRPDFLDPAIRRRFSAEIDMGMPSERAREEILRSLSRDLNLDEDVNFKELAKMTPGYVGSDLQYVVKAAVSESFGGNLSQLLDHARSQRGPDFLPNATQKQRDWLLLEDHRAASWGESRITMSQFRSAVSRVQPASKREGFSTIPDTTWADVGALDDVRKKLEMSIIGPIKDPELFTQVGIKPAAGILLWGPPGCGKTLVAKAVANESKANFISIKGPELLNKYVGESERAVRQLFARAKSSAPCILFFDEMDALAPRRDRDSLSDASARVVNTLLTELDGVGDRSGIYVIGATNRPDIIDEAIRRPGRLGTSIYVGLPSAEDRVDILKTLYRNTVTKARRTATAARNIGGGGAGADVDMVDASTSTAASSDAEVDLEKVALDMRCTGFSGADLGNLLQAAAQACLERAYLMKKKKQQQQGRGEGSGGEAPGSAAADADASAQPVITMEDWEKALSEVKPSIKDADKYDLAG